jgi:hypothetical protein
MIAATIIIFHWDINVLAIRYRYPKIVSFSSLLGLIAHLQLLFQTLQHTIHGDARTSSLTSKIANLTFLKRYKSG